MPAGAKNAYAHLEDSPELVEAIKSWVASGVDVIIPSKRCKIYEEWFTRVLKEVRPAPDAFKDVKFFNYFLHELIQPKYPGTLSYAFASQGLEKYQHTNDMFVLCEATCYGLGSASVDRTIARIEFHPPSP